MGQGRWGGERLIERPWLQLMCCAPVSSREIGRVFWSEGSCQDRGPKESSEGVMNIEWDYSYYQPWSDNEWLVDEMLAMLDEDVTMQ